MFGLLFAIALSAIWLTLFFMVIGGRFDRFIDWLDKRDRR